MKPLVWLTLGLALAAAWSRHSAVAEDATADEAVAESPTAQATPATKPAASDNAETATQDARRSLGRWWRFPWYDSSKDDIRPVIFREHKPVDLSLLTYLAWVVIALVLAGLVWLIVSSLLNRAGNVAREAAAQRVATRVDHVEALPFLRQRSLDDLLGQARQHYSAGNFNEAIIFLFSYQLVELDRRNLIRLAVGKTNRQYLRELRGRGALAGLVEQTMVAFEDVYFGGRQLGRQQFEAAWNRLAEFEALVGTFGPEMSEKAVSAAQSSAVLAEAVTAPH